MSLPAFKTRAKISFLSGFHPAAAFLCVLERLANRIYDGRAE
jgi:hypothetical protein